MRGFYLEDSMVKCICKTCKKEFGEKPARIRDGRGKYCSRKCMYSGKRVRKKCKICGKFFSIKKSHDKLRMCCSRKCGSIYKNKFFRQSDEWKIKMSKRNTGKSNPHWKGGFFVRRGYVYIYKPEHPFCGSTGYVKRSRFIMGKYLKRDVLPKEIIHHKNEIKDDDRIENLQLFDNIKGHSSYHGQLKKHSYSNHEG